MLDCFRAVLSMQNANPLLQLRAIRKAARFRQLLPTIEAKLNEGVAHGQIIAALAELGLELTTATYYNYLQRSRKRKPTAAISRSINVAVLAADERPQRPPKFDYDPRGNPDLLK